MGGLNLPSLSAFHKQQQVSRQCQLLTSADACVHCLAEKHLQKEDQLTQKIFKPAVVICDALVEDPGQPYIAAAAKRKVKDQEDSQRLLQVQDLQKQGEMLCATTSDIAAVWTKAVRALPFNTMKFFINTAHDTLQHNANLQL